MLYNIRGTPEIQVFREELLLEEGINRFKEKMLTTINQGRFTDTSFGGVLYRLGFEPIRDKIQDYLVSTQTGNQSKILNFIKLCSDDADVITYIILTKTLNNIASGKTSTTNLATNISKGLMDMAGDKHIKEGDPKLYAYLGREFRRATAKRKRMLIDKHISKLKNEDDVDTRALYLQSGVVLLKLIELSGANLFERVLVYDKHKHKKYIMRFSTNAQRIMSSIDSTELAMYSIIMKPLVVPPKPWTSRYNGGMYKLKTHLLTSSYATRKLKERDITKILPVVNKMQETSWRVNHRMLTLISTIFETDLRIGKIPPYVVRTWKDIVSRPKGRVSKEEWHAFNKRRQEVMIDLDSEFGERLELLYAIGASRELLKYDKFWFAYQLDYRGRLYPMTSYLNLLKGKFVKSLLEFGEGQYLNTDGKYWLSIHLANTYGLDKAPYNERLEWVIDNYDLINKVADDSLEWRNLWENADSPYEFVAACQAYVDALNGEKVYLPIQLDATCSGIQMYSGLLRDEVGGLSVNVIGHTRQDIYQQVANKANSLFEANEYDPIISYTKSDGELCSVLTETTAKSLRGQVFRQLVKRPTMTVPYNVSRYGMSEQIYDELKILEEEGKAFWSGDTWVANRLLTTAIHTSIYSIVDGARKGRDYLVALGKLWDEPARWYTPIYGFPVIQQTYKRKEKRIQTLYGVLIIWIEGEKHDKRRQANQIAPNYIHCIDSTVLLGVVDRTEGSIGTVHDCFLVPPNQGYEVQQHYKEAYVETMEADPLRLIQQQLDPEGEVEFPEYGSLDLQDVYDSEYIIS